MSAQREPAKIAKPVEVLADSFVRADPVVWMAPTPATRVKALDDWVKEFDKFLRDHRSQDLVRLSVQRIYKTICSVCNGTWEEDEGTCANCGAPTEQALPGAEEEQP